MVLESPPLHSSVAPVAQKLSGGRKERHPDNGPGEVEDPVVIGRRLTDEHAFQHLSDRPQVASIAMTDDVGAVFAAAGNREWHIVAQDVVVTIGGLI
jgi:hypothetical protein